MNKNKIKATYIKTSKNIRGEQILCSFFINCYRHPKTNNERKNDYSFINFLEDEYYEIEKQFNNKISRRNRKKLAILNFGLVPGIFEKEKSWKHNSKRKNQWKH